MDKKNDNSGSENAPFSDGVELFDSIFSEGADATATDTKKEQPRSPAASAKTVTPKPVKQTEQIPAPPKEQQTKKAAPPAQPIKKSPTVKPDTPMEKQPGSDSKNESFSDGVELFDDIFSEGTKAAATDTRKDQSPSPTPSGKAPTPSPVKKIEQRPESPKPPPVQKTVPQAQPIKKSPTVKPDTPMEKQPGSGSENEPFPGGVELFDDIFSERTKAAVADATKDQSPPSSPSGKVATPTPVKKAEQSPVPQKELQTKKAAPQAQPTKVEHTAQDSASGKQPAPAPSAKADTPTVVKKAEQSPVPQKELQTKKAAPQAQPTKVEHTAQDSASGKQPAPVPSAKAVSSTVVKKAEPRPEHPDKTPVQKVALPAQPIKKSPTVRPDTVKEKQPDQDSENGSLSDGVGLFDDIFSEGTDAYLPEIKKVQPHSPAPRAKAVVTSKTAIEVEKTPEPPKGPSIQKAPPQIPIVKSEPSFGADTYVGKISGKYEESEKQETEFHEKTRKNVNPFIFVSSIIVLVLLSMMTGRIIDYDGIIGYVKKTAHLQSDKKAQNIIEEKKDTKASKVADKESKKQDSNVQATQVSKAVTPPVKNATPAEKAVPVQVADKVIPGEVDNKAEKSPVTAAPVISEKVTNEDTDVLNGKTLSYPYSIYLGSYDTIEGVKEAKSDFEEMGLSPYWIRMDLGEKGIWFRLYANYFQTREEVDRFIKNIQIPDAESKKTNFVNLVGIYTSQEEAYKQKEGIEKLGYCPYVIEDNKNIFRLYVGAFYQKELAEEQNSDLLLKGIQSKVVER